MACLSIIGGGSYATALVKIFTETLPSTDRLIWWHRNPEVTAHIQRFHHNPNYLSSVFVDPTKVMVSNDLASAIAQADYVILAVPSAFLSTSLQVLPPNAFAGKQVVSVIKGVVPQSNQIVANYLADHWKVPMSHISMITGPSHAEEIALEKLTFLTVAGYSDEPLTFLKHRLENRYIRVITSSDLIGVEYATVLKNVYAIAAGIFHGLGFGDNFLAFFLTNALKETKRFIGVVSPSDRDIEESAYLGDLLVTAYSQFSRNRTLGSMVGKGYSVQAAQAEMNMVAEGYYATACLHHINQSYRVDMPILHAVHQILYEKAAPRHVMEELAFRLN